MKEGSLKTGEFDANYKGLKLNSAEWATVSPPGYF
jgi:hypothetical protein